MIAACGLLACAGIALGSPGVGDAAPGELGRDREGQALTVNDFRGRVLIVSFWASWCAPCLDEMRLLENLQQRWGTQRLAVVGINWQQSAREFRDLAQRLSAVRVQLTQDPDGRIGRSYAIHEIPQLFVIDAQGIVRYRHVGGEPVTLAVELSRELDTLLRDSGDAAASGTPARETIDHHD